MKSMYKVFGIIIMVMLIGLLAVGCGGTGPDKPNGGDGDAPSTSGRLTITGLDAYNGLYISAEGWKYGNDDDADFFAGGGMSLSGGNITSFTGTKISNGQAVLNVWEAVYEEIDDYEYELTKLSSYNGNDQNVEFVVGIFSGSTYSGGNNGVADGEVYPVNFNNGIATAAISNIIPVIKVNLGNGIEGELLVYEYDDEMMIFLYSYALAQVNELEDYRDAFTIKIDGTETTPAHMGIDDNVLSFFFDEGTFVAGQEHTIQIVYTNDTRKIKIYDDDLDEPPANAAILANFDTGEKNVIVRED